ncbi:MAG: hypothetical protein EHM28_10695 [Spirochaetaceae bacterium]|nr:MAG: hypothetical protein EHM28_10695 [Spirochaetaceae bacterium]
MLSARTKPADAVELWASKAGQVFTALEYGLSLGSGYGNQEEAKQISDRMAIRDHVRKNLPQGGWKRPRVYLVGDSTIQAGAKNSRQCFFQKPSERRGSGSPYTPLFFQAIMSSSSSGTITPRPTTRTVLWTCRRDLA